jgi:hypothetical protein
MKLLATAIFAGMLAFGTVSYAKEEPKKTEATVPAEAPKTKKACIKTIDAKTKKEVEKCRTVKVHKKYEGTAVDGAKKDSVKK